MKVSEARGIIGQALRDGRIDRDEAGRRHNAISRVARNKGRVQIWVADLQTVTIWGTDRKERVVLVDRGETVLIPIGPVWRIVDERNTDKCYGSFDSEDSARREIAGMLQVVTRTEGCVVWFTHRALDPKPRWPRFNETTTCIRRNG